MPVPSYGGGRPGVPGYATSDQYTTCHLLAGDIPDYGAARSFPFKTGTDLPINSVVGTDADGNLTLATNGGTTPVSAVGILTTTITADQAAGTVDVIQSGNFNINALNWDSSFATDAEKLAAGKPGSTLQFGVNPNDGLP